MLSNKKAVSWEIFVAEGRFKIEFEHGTTSGKRVIRVNDKEWLRKDWMFRLVGTEFFRIGRHQLTLEVEPDGAFGFIYDLSVDGCKLDEFKQLCKKNLVTWNLKTNEGKEHRIVLERETVDIWIDGQKLKEPSSRFTEEGNEISFVVDDNPIIIKSNFSGSKKKGMIYHLFLNENLVETSEE